MINLTAFPAGVWLLEQGYDYDTNLHQDSDGDGVNLLMAYQLEIDPRWNLRGGLPARVLIGGQLNFGFYGAAPGVAWRVETTTDLTNWTVVGVTSSTPDGNGIRTATVNRDGPSRLLRLVIEQLSRLPPRYRKLATSPDVLYVTLPAPLTS